MRDFETLLNLETGDSCTVLRFKDDRMASKLLSMGVLPGKTLHLVRRAPFGGGFYIKVNEHCLAMRAEEADSIIIKK